jgi:hypothetical protein
MERGLDGGDGKLVLLSLIGPRTRLMKQKAASQLECPSDSGPYHQINAGAHNDGASYQKPRRYPGGTLESHGGLQLYVEDL